MRTERVAVLLVLGLAVVGPLAAQTSVNAATQVRTVTVRVKDREVPEDLALQVATQGRGSAIGLRKFFGWVPFVPPVESRPFDPFSVQRDKERLRQFYVRIGFPRARVEYDVTHDEVKNEVEVVFTVEPGKPMVMSSLSLQWMDSTDAPDIAPDAALAEIRDSVALKEGEPIDQRNLPSAAAVLVRWLGTRGHAFATAHADVEPDADSLNARVILRATAGPRARIAEIAVEGNQRLSDEAVRGFFTIRPGEWFDLSRLSATENRVTALEIVRRASIEVPPGQPLDTMVNLTLRVREDLPRAVSGQFGYATNSGITGEAQWTHRNFGGNGQALTGSLTLKTGFLAIEDLFERDARASLTYRLPVPGRARLTAYFGPFAEYRDDYRDQSVKAGVENTLVYLLGRQSSIALRYELSARHVYDYRSGEFEDGINIIDLIEEGAQGLLDSLGASFNVSELTLSATLGNLDVPADPRRGFVLIPSISTTFPSFLSSTQYVIGDLRGSAYVPFGKSLVGALRVGAGRLFPFGKSIPADSREGVARFFQLRDELFTAGGMGDVRGWADRLLGPKFPEIIVPIEGDTLGVPYADRYVPLGGFNRINGSVELRGPVPFLGKAWGAHGFLDAGRVWTDDARFLSGAEDLDDERLQFGTGLGIDYITIVGAIRITLGYKLNPSLFDLLDPNDVTRAIVDEVPLETLKRHNARRFQLHIGIGRRL